ncbi:MAG: metal ABC transporter permease [Odoribacter sp.]|nr:metal ABC transporter permease [Odoribacter sp.]
MISQLFQYQFFIYAILGVALLSIGAAMIGTYIITRRLVAISGGITHACFGGLGLGYFLGINPVAMAAVFAVGSSMAVEAMSSRLRLREDSAIAVVWALGMAVGVLFVFLTPGYVPELNSFLFGNILTITTVDLLCFAVFTVLLSAFYIWQHSRIVACSFDRDFARVSGLPVRFITYTMTVFVAVGIVLTIRLVGVMLLMSMLSLPIMTAEIFCRRYFTTMFASMAVSLLTSLGGLFIGAVVDVPCSAIIVLLMASTFMVSKAVDSIKYHLLTSKM